MRCTCDKSSLFPRCIKNPDYCIKLDKDEEVVDWDNRDII